MTISMASFHDYDGAFISQEYGKKDFQREIQTYS